MPSAIFQKFSPDDINAHESFGNGSISSCLESGGGEDFAESLLKDCHRLVTKLEKLVRSLNSSANSLNGRALKYLEESEQIISAMTRLYGDFEKASAALSSCKDNKDKLPEVVLKTILYACLRQHEFSVENISNLYDLYGDQVYIKPADELGMSCEISIITGFMARNKNIKAQRPSLRNRRGSIAIMPAAYFMVHESEFYRKMSAIFRGGIPSINKILRDYRFLDESSRNLMDRELARRVYYSTMQDDHPVRHMLRDKLNDFDDLRIRMQEAFRCDIENDIDVKSKSKFEHAFKLVEKLKSHREEVLSVISKCYLRAVNGHCFDVGHHSSPLGWISRILAQAKKYGFDPICALSDTYEFKGEYDKTIYLIMESLSKSNECLSIKEVCLAGAIIETDEAYLATIGLSEKHFAWLYQYTGSATFRACLQKTDSGRERVFLQDLGL